MTFCLFQVATPYVVKGSNLFVLPGEVVEGDVRPGMFLSVPFNSSLELTAPVHAIEYASSSADRSLSLVVKCEREEDLELWASIGLQDEDLIITEDHP